MKKFILLILAVVLANSLTAQSESTEIQNLVSKYYGEWNDNTYQGLITDRVPNTALMGNGDIGVTSGGDKTTKTFYISKGDFWAYNGAPVLIGGVSIGKYVPEAEDPQKSSLAYHVTVTSSASHPSFPASRMVSGDWALGYEGWVSANVSSATTVVNPFWAELDLGTAKTFNKIVIRHDAAARPAQTANITMDFSVHVRNTTTEAWTKIAEVTNNHEPLNTIWLDTEATGRYVRLEITKGTQETTADSRDNARARIGQFELYLAERETGTPAEPTTKLHEIQDIFNAEVRSEFEVDAIKLNMRTFTSAVQNMLVTEITSTSDAPVELSANLWVKADNTSYAITGESTASSVTVSRTTPNNSASNPASHKSKAVLSAKLIGASYTTVSNNSKGTAGLVFTIEPGQTVYVVTSVGGGGRTFDYNGALLTENPVTQANALLSPVTDKAAVDNLLDAHREWWKNYWATSYIKLDDSDAKLNTLMKYYYAAQYELGCNIRQNKIAPGLYGVWHTNDSPSWKSDYHLNYNFISTFYGVNTSNRVEQGIPAINAILQYVEQGKKNASNVTELRKVRADFVDSKIAKGDISATNGIPNAVLYTVGIGPWGMTLDAGYHNEALNATFSAYPMIEYYNYTLDKEFLEESLYEYLKLCVGFYEAWLENEDGKYVLYAGYNEGSWSMNPAVELSVLKSALRNLIDASVLLNKDAEKRPVWQNILDNLAPQPTAIYEGKSVYTLAEKDWRPGDGAWQPMSNPVPGDGNIIPMESVIPGEVMGYYSASEQLQTAKNTIDVFSGRGAWGQANNFPKIYSVAVNTRYPVQTIIDNMASTITGKMKPNLMIEDNIHGVEKAGATEAINNMMLLSDQGIMTVFPGWVNKNAKFARLREKGAFVVSAEYSATAQEVVYVDITSEAGQKATIRSPWAEGIKVTDGSGNTLSTVKTAAPNHPDESIYSFDTEAGKNYHIIKSDGTGIVSPKNDEYGIRAYPNPVVAGSTVNIETGLTGASIEVYDLAGKLIQKTATTGAITPIKVGELPGIYTLVVKSKEGYKETIKLIAVNK
ncbi:glycosyl hydrolase family 95 catalytic domain-containing protein [Viscerimonas tarda]